MHKIQTERLLIEKASLNDDAFFYELMNTPKWLKFIGDRGIKSIADAKAYIKDVILNGFNEFGFGFYVVRLKTTKEPIGIVGFVKREHLEYPDFGFGFLPQYEKQGYALEASLATLKYGSTKLGLTNVLAITLNSNTESINLLQKLGFSFVENIEEKHKNSGEIETLQLYNKLFN